ncbi:hypothetical protein [Alkaliphilus metalliredigens]|nr:hypothetical protein [Alkaliphilus metalliredigens]
MKEKMTDKYKESIRDRQVTLVIISINIVLFFPLNTIPNLNKA